MAFAMKYGFALVALGLAAAARAGPVEVAVGGLRAGGTLYVALQSRDEFMKPGGTYGRMIAGPMAGDLVVRFPDVKPGDYAVTLWHDDNGNGSFDADPASGRPLDGWAFSRATALTGAPTFDDVKIAIPAEGVKLSLPVHYGRGVGEAR
jgi:uncharacterized protein (DUF2141 family)